LDDCPTIVNPKTPIITVLNEIELTTSGGAFYQWYWNNQAINNATSAKFKAINSGNYTVQLKSDKGCISPMSKAVTILITGVEEKNRIQIYPNPFKEEISIDFPNTWGSGVEVSVFDLRGSRVFYHESITNKSFIKLGRLAAGMYFLHLKSIQTKETSIWKILKTD
jgi:hypothetical protein